MLFLERASVTLALASWGFFFFFLVSAAFFGFAAVALAARATVAFAGRALVALAARAAVALAGRVAVAFAGRVAVALAGLVAVALAGLGAVALAARVAVAFVETVRGVGGASTGAAVTGAARAAAGGISMTAPMLRSAFRRVWTGFFGGNSSADALNSKISHGAALMTSTSEPRPSKLDLKVDSKNTGKFGF